MSEPAFPPVDLAHHAAQPDAAAHSHQQALLRLMSQAARSAFLLRPRWEGLPASPLLVAGLTIATIIASILLERLYIGGAATFYWPALANGWFGVASTAWICYLLRPDTGISKSVEGMGQPPIAKGAPDASHLLCLLLAQSLVLEVSIGLPIALLMRANQIYDFSGIHQVWFTVLWLGPVCWGLLAQFRVVRQEAGGRRGLILVSALAMLAATVLYYSAGNMQFWYEAEETAGAASHRKRLELTQELMEAQPHLLQRRLAELRPQRSGVADVYAVTFAPYASEDVFQRESEMVAQVMAQRFDAGGRTLQLVNNASTLDIWPWATPLNLQRSIRRVAQLMNPEEDIFFIHLTSHGAADGELAAGFWPMTVEKIHPEELKKWLDEAGIKHRVISVSACYSGSWITPLADENTLVMTAADADHTSYGCGRKSELTFFGRAMFDEQLRRNTFSFEQAHAAARPVIEQREQAAGKTDGYSNPQISVGSAIRARLAGLEQRLLGEEKHRQPMPAPPTAH